jgi:hypothetical protein
MQIEPSEDNYGLVWVRDISETAVWSSSPEVADKEAVNLALSYLTLS